MLKLTKEQEQKLTAYLALLYKWNQKHNLTAINNIEEMRLKHVQDSLSVAPYLQQEQGLIVDVGTGAGLPGIPLAIALPQQKFLLIDSRQKKIAFVQHAISTLQLNNVEVMWGRIEDYHSRQTSRDNLAKPIGVVISRAFAASFKFASLCNNLGDRATRFIIMKGKCDNACLESLPTGYVWEQLLPITVSGLEARRTLGFFKRRESWQAE